MLILIGYLVIHSAICLLKMGSSECGPVENDQYKKSAAYGLYEHIVESNREYAVIEKSIARSKTSLQELRL